MTLDEVIKYCVEVAEKERDRAHIHEDMMVFKRDIKHHVEAECHEALMNEHIKCAEEHEQLAVWLKELKQLRERRYREALEQESVLDKIEEEIKDTLYVDSLIFTELIDFKNGKIDADDVIEEFNRVTRMEVLRIIDKYKLESEGKE